MKMVKQKGARTGRAGKRRSVVAAINRGAWTAAEDDKLVEYVRIHGDKNWRTLPENAGLNRCGKSCRLRWLNYLRPGIKRGNMTEEEDDLIIRLHNLIGNRWSLIAARLPGRTDNEIKNYWNAHLSKRSLSLDDLNRKLYQKIQIRGGGGGTVVRPLPTRLASGCRRDFTPTMMSPMLYHVDDDSAWIPPSRTTSAHEDDPHLQGASSPDELTMTHAAVFDLDVDQILDSSGGGISCSTTAGGYTELGGEAQDFSVQGEASGTKFEGQAAVWELDDLDKLINCEEYLRGL